jgi:hypothetical protein
MQLLYPRCSNLQIAVGFGAIQTRDPSSETDEWDCDGGSLPG